MTSRSSAKKNARERLHEQQAKEQVAVKRRATLLRAGIVIGVVVAIVAVFGVVQWQRSRVDASADFPQGAAALGQGVSFGKANAPVLVEMFEDFSCPHCKEFEDEAEPVLKEYLDAGKIRMVFFPVTLDSFGRPTELAANAFACAADEGKGREYQQALYANFSQEWTNSQLVDLGKQFDLGSGFRACVNREKFADYVRSIDKTFTSRGGTGTPTIFVDGKALDSQDTTATALRLAIAANVAKAGQK